MREDISNLCKKLAPKDASASNNSSEAIYFCQDLAHPLS